MSKNNKNRPPKIGRRKIKKILLTLLFIAMAAWAGKGIYAAVTDTTYDNPSVLREDDNILGNRSAPVALVEYGDFQCEACRAQEPNVKRLLAEFPNDLKVVYRYFPLTGHKNGFPAALAAEAAAQQGKFKEMHDLLFERQDDWGGLGNPKEIFERYAAEIGLDAERFSQDIESDQTDERVKRDQKLGFAMQVNSTPSFFVDGTKIDNPKNYETFKKIMEVLIENTKSRTAKEAKGEKVHKHADILVMLDGKSLDLSADKYQSSKENPLSEDSHLHDKNGDDIHNHRENVTMGEFFTSLGMAYSKDCFKPDTATQYCNSEAKKLRMFVNGKENTAFDSYTFDDLDRILITYGSPSPEEIQKQIASVPDKACLYSAKCPERGTPPTENCVVGMGGDC